MIVQYNPPPPSTTSYFIPAGGIRSTGAANSRNGENAGTRRPPMITRSSGHTLTAAHQRIAAPAFRTHSASAPLSPSYKNHGKYPVSLPRPLASPIGSGPVAGCVADGPPA